MPELRVGVVPTALAAESDTDLRLKVWLPGGKLRVRPIADAGEAFRVAAELTFGPKATSEDTSRLFRIQKTAWVPLDDGDSPAVLLFLVPLPMWAPAIVGQESLKTAKAEHLVIDSSNPDWEPLVRRRSGHLDVTNGPIRQTIVSRWQHELETTTAAFDFLPKFFTTSQLRSVYASAWGLDPNADLDAANFNKWLHKGKNAGVCVPVSASEVRESVEERFADELAGRQVGEDARLAATGELARMGAPIVGLGLRAAGLGPLGLIAGIAGAAAIAGAAVAFQTSTAPGKPPQWYRRAEEQTVPLREYFKAPRSR